MKKYPTIRTYSFSPIKTHAKMCIDKVHDEILKENIFRKVRGIVRDVVEDNENNRYYFDWEFYDKEHFKEQKEAQQEIRSKVAMKLLGVKVEYFEN